MIFKIDDQCLDILKDTKDLKILTVFDKLALSRRQSENLIIASREILDVLTHKNEISLVSRNIFAFLRDKITENKLIQNSVCIMFVIVPSLQNISNEVNLENNTKIWVTFDDLVDKNFLNKAILLAENNDDCCFYEIIGNYFAKNNGFEKIRIRFEHRGGGGSTISDNLQGIIDESDRLCLCIADSDKKYGGDPGKGTIEKLRKICLTQYTHLLELKVQEIENLIPFSLLEYITKVYGLNVFRGLDFIQYLMKDVNWDNPAWFFDYKNGIPSRKIVLSDNSSEDDKTKFGKYEAYRKYWIPILNSYGITDFANDADVIDEYIIHGISKSLLEYLLCQVCNNSSLMESLLLEDYIIDEWDRIGRIVYSWGCAGEKIY